MSSLTLGQNSNESIKDIFIKWSENVDINGYKKIFERQENFAARSFWVLVFLASTFLTFYLIASSILNFLAYDVVIKIEVVYERPTQFPSVTFCDNNPFTTLESQQLFENISNIFNLSLTSLDFSVYYLALMKVANPDFGDVNRQLLGLSLDNIICIYAENDCLTDLKHYWDFR